ncbi:peptidylprolyl isomerase [Bordetella sp. BOR01]|uniref:peptidylprolyl isomerase n=1 Tax=Bordetella sp. BOR01 TaxID=2854779 RepID=UPI001C458279|nr:peptidylprolyl isomerase [Bordetella sp. BOR01]MBV7485170.1 peptidyl-prolyl cis-trans isomerase [Bordetella sp. BOR01]
MPVIVNGVELSDADLEQELPYHGDAANPQRRAITALVLRRVMLDEARRLRVSGASDAAIIDALLDTHATSPEPDDAACRRHYDTHPERFTVGELVEVDHILFQVTPQVDLQRLRERAEAVLQEVQAQPTRFAELARALSNCPSAAVGGSLGRLGRGDTVPEFERAVFGPPAGAVLPRLVETRHGLHIVRVARHVAGRLLPYSQVAPRIAQALAAASRDTAWRQYARMLVGRARIEGIELEGADGLLVQ